MLHEVVHVSAFAADCACCELLFHMDDGAIAGPWLAVQKALSSSQELDPPLGLFVNPTKCELFSRGDLISFPMEMNRSNVPHLEILGEPIGNLIFCAKLVAKKRASALKLLNQLNEVGTVDPQVVTASVWWVLQIGALVEIYTPLFSV